MKYMITFNFYNQLAECDILFSHNHYDANWYKGLYPGKRVEIMPTLMVEELIKTIEPKPENKAIIGGNFSRWYGGFQSYMVATDNSGKHILCVSTLLFPIQGMPK